MADSPIHDGRRARRERSRAAVVDAMFSLIQEGKLPPSVEDVAERAGVSVSSVFRNFEGLPDLQRRALDSFHSRFEHLLVVNDATRDRSVRVRSHVRARVELCSEAGGLMRIGRARALDHEPIVDGMARLRARLADQTRQRFASEIAAVTPAAAANLVALVDATTSPEAFDVMTGAHSRSPRQVANVWVTALDTLLFEWTIDDDSEGYRAPANPSVPEGGA